MYGYSSDFGGSLPSTADSQAEINNGFDEANRTIDELIKGLGFLRQSMTDYWEGPAAIEYARFLGESIDLTMLKEMISRFENELILAQSQIICSQGE